MDSKTIRYKNTRILVEQVGGVSNFALKINKGQSQTSQFAGSSPIKGIGNKVAREIEEAFGKQHGWLDIPHNERDLKLQDSTELRLEISGKNQLKILVDVNISFDSECNLWVADCESLGINTEAETYEAITQIVRDLVPEMLNENNINLGNQSITLCFKQYYEF